MGELGKDCLKGVCRTSPAGPHTCGEVRKSQKKKNAGGYPISWQVHADWLVKQRAVLCRTCCGRGALGHGCHMQTRPTLPHMPIHLGQSADTLNAHAHVDHAATLPSKFNARPPHTPIIITTTTHRQLQGGSHGKRRDSVCVRCEGGG